MTTKVKWIGGWSDESEAVRELARMLKAEGVRARTGYSPYVGHRELVVAKADLEKAQRVLRKFFGEGYIADALGKGLEPYAG